MLFGCQGSGSVCLHCKRRRRDLNPRAAINDLHPFQGCPFSHLGYFSKCLNQHSNLFRFIILYRNDLFQILRLHPLFSKRRGWDSNPRALADKRFSRPPRYDHFDISPCHFLLSCCLISSARFIIYILDISVNNFFKIFLCFFLISDLPLFLQESLRNK